MVILLEFLGKTHDGDDEELLAFNRWDEFYGFNNGASNFIGDMNRTHNPIFHNKKIISNLYSKRGINNSDINKDGILVKYKEDYLTDKIGDMAIQFIEKNNIFFVIFAQCCSWSIPSTTEHS